MLDWLMGHTTPAGPRLYAVAYLVRNRNAGTDVLSSLAVIAVSPDEATGKAYTRIQEAYPVTSGWDTPRMDVTEINKGLIRRVLL